MAIIADEANSQRAAPPTNQNSKPILQFQSSVESTDSSVTAPTISMASTSIASNIMQVVCTSTEAEPQVNPDVAPAGGDGNHSGGTSTSGGSTARPLVESDDKPYETAPLIDEKTHSNAEVASTTTGSNPDTPRASEVPAAINNDQASQQETGQGNNQRGRRKSLCGGCFTFLGRQT
uniref:Uncharacterized protein n=1 Tax=Panagrellus redivivus TaxID=6233 RepID=A0A7E4W1U2_PANRE